MVTIQAIIFKKDSFTKRKADAWLKRHNHVRIKPFHETLNYLRARLQQRNEDKYEYRIIKFNDGIKAVIEYPKIKI